MKNIVFFFGSFDPLHKGHISIIEKAIETINASTIYIGLNKSSSKGKLTALLHRKNMIKEYVKTNKKCKLLPFNFDFENINKTYEKIFKMLDKNNHYYILVGQDQLNSLKDWYNYSYLIENFTFIIAKRGNSKISDEYLNNPKYIFMEHDYKYVSSTSIKQGDFRNTIDNIAKYIVKYNIYLKKKIEPYVSEKRYKHILSVNDTALLINKKGKLGLDPYDIEKAALLHDVARDMDEKVQLKLMQKYYPQYLKTHKNIYHQYIGEHLAHSSFHIDDTAILNAIKYHTTGRAHMSTLEKLIYVSDKIEPTRKYDTSKLLNDCIQNFEKGFINVLNHNKNYIKDILKENYEQDTISCFKYYLK